MDVSDLTKGSVPDPMFQSISVPDWFVFAPEEPSDSLPVSNSLDHDLHFYRPSELPTRLPNSHGISLEETTRATDASGLPVVASIAQNMQDQGQIINPTAALPRRRSRYNIRKFGQKTDARPIPISAQPPDPLERWHESPPEDEPASMSAIMKAVQSSEDFNPNDFRGLPARNRASFRNYRRPVSAASSNSGNSGNSATSRHSSGSRQSVSGVQDHLGVQSYDGSERVRKNGTSRKSNAPSHHRSFYCTFCCDTFKTKHDWSRHEKSLHLNLGGWMCAPNGGAPISETTGRRHCAFCSCLDPSAGHLAQHNFTQCSRTFRRKDHLVQHLRLVHRLNVLPLIDTWKTPELVVTSRCGFCDCRLHSWDERVEHLAVHFRQGFTMDKWRGEHDFPPFIAGKVTNSLPPYLIGTESKTVVPFSATNSNVRDHFTQISRRAQGFENEEENRLTSSFRQLETTEERPLGTFTQILTQHLGRYARQMMSCGIVPTDEMFQDQARRLLYDSGDSWNQTIADNPEWIASFREQHSASLEGSDSPEAADTGSRIGFLPTEI